MSGMNKRLQALVAAHFVLGAVIVLGVSWAFLPGVSLVPLGIAALAGGLALSAAVNWLAAHRARRRMARRA